MKDIFILLFETNDIQLISYAQKQSFQRCSVKKVFLKISQKSLEGNCVAVLSCRHETCKFIKNETPTQLLFEFFWDNSRGCFSNI